MLVDRNHAVAACRGALSPHSKTTSFESCRTLFLFLGGNSNGDPSPANQFLAVFEHFRRNFEIIYRRGAPRFFVNKRSQAAADVIFASSVVRFEVEPPIHNNSEESIIRVQSVPAKHSLCPEAGQGIELIADEVHKRSIVHYPSTGLCFASAFFNPRSASSGNGWIICRNPNGLIAFSLIWAIAASTE